jgi:hypothetical protein
MAAAASSLGPEPCGVKAAATEPEVADPKDPPSRKRPKQNADTNKRAKTSAKKVDPKDTKVTQRQRRHNQRVTRMRIRVKVGPQVPLRAPRISRLGLAAMSQLTRWEPTGSSPCLMSTCNLYLLLPSLSLSLATRTRGSCH